MRVLKESVNTQDKKKHSLSVKFLHGENLKITFIFGISTYLLYIKEYTIYEYIFNNNKCYGLLNVERIKVTFTSLSNNSYLLYLLFPLFYLYIVLIHEFVFYNTKNVSITIFITKYYRVRELLIFLTNSRFIHTVPGHLGNMLKNLL